MKNWFKNLDLERAIILVALLLMPVAGGWVYYLQNQIKLGKEALQDAISEPDGQIMMIAMLQKQITQLKKGESAGDQVKEPRVYFERAVRQAQANYGDVASKDIRRQDFSISVSNRSTPVPGNRGLEDTELTMHFKKNGREAYAVGRSFLNAFIFNVESGGSRAWKLRTLKMVNRTYKTIRSNKEMPPEEIPDFWFPEKVVFVRRSVAKKKK